jgi:hypothetical protein
MRLRIACIAACALGAWSAQAEPDENPLGKQRGYPVGTNAINGYANGHERQRIAGSRAACGSDEDPVPVSERAALWRGVLRSLGGSID